MMTTSSRRLVTELTKVYSSSPKILYATDGTRYRYLSAVRNYLRKCKGDLDRSTLLSYVLTLPNSSASYKRWNYQVLRGFFETIGEPWPLHPKELPKEEEPERPYLETDEATELLELSKQSQVDYAMFRLVLITGIRKRELRDLSLGDYDPPRIRIETRKGGERRIRTLDEETVNALDVYINGDRRYWDGKYYSRDEPLFLSPRGNRFPDSTLTKRFAAYMRIVGKPKGTGMHALRRTVVTWESESGMDTLRIQKLHGWKSNKMVEIYARLKPGPLEKESYEGNPLIRGTDSA